jgi:uncharacterized protein (DUF433 family)
MQKVGYIPHRKNPLLLKKKEPSLSTAEQLEEHRMDYQQYLIRDPQICGGELVIKGTRVTLRTILASLAEGATIDEIVEDFPTVTEPAVRAVIAFAATSAEEDLPLPSVPSIL